MSGYLSRLARRATRDLGTGAVAPPELSDSAAAAGEPPATAGERSARDPFEAAELHDDLRSPLESSQEGTVPRVAPPLDAPARAAEPVGHGRSRDEPHDPAPPLSRFPAALDDRSAVPGRSAPEPFAPPPLLSDAPPPLLSDAPPPLPSQAPPTKAEPGRDDAPDAAPQSSGPAVTPPPETAPDRGRRRPVRPEAGDRRAAPADPALSGAMPTRHDVPVTQAARPAPAAPLAHPVPPPEEAAAERSGLDRKPGAPPVVPSPLDPPAEPRPERVTELAPDPARPPDALSRSVSAPPSSRLDDARRVTPVRPPEPPPPAPARAEPGLRIGELIVEIIPPPEPPPRRPPAHRSAPAHASSHAAAASQLRFGLGQI